MLLSSTSNRFDSIVQLLTLVLVFIFVLALAYVAVKLKQMRALLKKVEGEKIKGVKTLIMPARIK